MLSFRLGKRKLNLNRMGANSPGCETSGLVTDDLKSFRVEYPCQSSPSLAIPVPLWFVIISLVFFYLCKYYFQVSFNLSMVKITQNTVAVLLYYGHDQTQDFSRLRNLQLQLPFQVVIFF